MDLSRYQALAAQNAISAQQLATQQATVGAQAGIVDVDRPQVSQAAINLAYTRIMAPFDGIVTSRAVDVGNLVTMGTANRNTAVHRLRSEQDCASMCGCRRITRPDIRPGMTVNFTVPQYPGPRVSGDPGGQRRRGGQRHRHQLVQFATDNADGALQPGAYAEMQFPLPAAPTASACPPPP